MPPKRRYIQKSAKELEALFESVKSDAPTLKLILAELKHRSTPSATALRERVEKQLTAFSKPKPEAPPHSPPPHSAPEAPSHYIVDCKGCGTKVRIPVKGGSIVYRCPKCKLTFEADYRNSVMEILFFKEEQAASNQEQMTEGLARSVLGVALNATFVEIKSAWRALSQQYHPDKHQSLPERLRKAAEVEMGRINQAYQLLARVSAQDF